MSTIGLENQQVPGVRDAITAAEKAGEKAEGATKEAAKAAAEAKRAADYADEAIGTAQEAIQVAEEATEATNNATNTLNEKIDEINESLDTVKEAADVAMGMEEKLDNEIAAREADRDNLQTNINNVMNKEIMDVNFLQENINKEVEARIAGDKANSDATTAAIDGVKEDVQKNAIAISQNEQNIAQAQENITNITNEITEIKTEASEAYDKEVQVDTQVTGNDSTVSITKTVGNLKDDNTQDTELPLPVASETQAGVINPATYKQIQDASEKIEILMSNIVLAPNLPNNPTSDQIGEAYREITGSDVIPNGARLTGPDGTTYVYYGSDGIWVKSADTGGTVDVKNFTNTASGMIKGSTEDGKVFAESDGSGSVNGWDNLVARANSHDSEIENIKTDLAVENTRTQNLPSQVMYNTSLSEYATDKVTANLVLKDLLTGGDATLPVEIGGATSTSAGVMTAQQANDLANVESYANQLGESIDNLEAQVNSVDGRVDTLETSNESSGERLTEAESNIETLNTAVQGKQDTLVSGTNIKTVNGESVLGSGDITLGGGGLSEVYYKFGSASDYSKTGAELISIDLPSTGVYWVSFYVYTSSNSGTTEVYLNQGSNNYPAQYQAMYQRRTITSGNLDGVSNSGLVNVTNTHLAVIGKHSGGNVLCMDSSIVAIKMD